MTTKLVKFDQKLDIKYHWHNKKCSEYCSWDEFLESSKTWKMNWPKILNYERWVYRVFSNIKRKTYCKLQDIGRTKYGEVDGKFQNLEEKLRKIEENVGKKIISNTTFLQKQIRENLMQGKKNWQTILEHWNMK